MFSECMIKWILWALLVFLLFCSNARAQQPTYLLVKTLGSVDLHVYNTPTSIDKQHVGLNYTTSNIDLKILGTFYYSGPDEDVVVTPGTYNYTPNGVKQMTVIQGGGLVSNGVWENFIVRVVCKNNENFVQSIVSVYEGTITDNATQTVECVNGTMLYSNVIISNIVGPMDTYVFGPNEFLKTDYPTDNIQTDKASIIVNGTIFDKEIKNVNVNSANVNTLPSGISDYATFNTSVNLVEGNNLIEVKTKEQSGYECVEKRNVLLSTGGDHTPPVITIASPTNTTYNSGIVALEYSVDEATTWVGFSLDSQSNTTISGNTVITGLKDGPHIIVVYARDSAGNTGRSQVFFTLNVPWSIEPITLPENVATVGAYTYFYARINQEGEPVESGSANYTLDGINGSLRYSYYYDFWVAYDIINLTQEKKYNLNVSGYKNSLYKGSANKAIDVGSLKVIIDSNEYKSGKNFTISARVFSGSNPQPVRASYKIKNETFYTRLSGNLDCFGNVCNKTLMDLSELGDDWYDYVLEINVSNSTIGKFGGNWSFVAKWYPETKIETDKDEYKPGENVKIDLYADEEITGANFTIWDLFSTPLAFEKVNSTHWTKTYQLGTDLSRDMYWIDATVVINGEYNYESAHFHIIKSPTINIAIDNENKKPGEKIAIDVTSDDYIYQANYTIMKPDGTVETGPTSLLYVSQYELSRNYSLGVGVVEGVYAIKVRANVEGTIVEKSVNFVVTAWNLFAVLNKYNFNKGETANLSINILDAYSSDLTFNLTVNLTEPGGSRTEIHKSYPKGSSNTFVAYSFPDNYLSGTSIITVYLVDYYGRRRENSLIFTTNIKNGTNATHNDSLIPFLSVTPYMCSEITTIGKVFQRSFELENTANASISSISVDIPASLSKIVYLVSAPSTISKNSKSNLTLKINTSEAEAKNYSDFVKIYSSNGNPQIYVSIEVVGNISLEVEDYMSQISSLEEEIKSLENQGKDVKSVLEILESARQTLGEAADYYEAEDLNLAKIKMESAISSLSDLKDQIESMKTVRTEGNDYSIIIWVFATFAAIAVIGIFLIKRFTGGKEETIEVYSQRDL